MTSNPQTGAIIDQGPQDWQVIQQDKHGFASVSLEGRCVVPQAALCQVQVRIAEENTGASVSRTTDWRDAETLSGERWQIRFDRVPAGGLYRIETRVITPETIGNEWGVHGDMRHHVGIGDLWVIAGQSNSAGYGRGPIYDPPELGIHLFRNSMKWDLASHPLNESTGTAHPANRENANPKHSPYLAFARTVKRALGFPIGLIQTSLGGAGLTPWNPTEPGDHPLWDVMETCVRAVGGRVKGVLWYQGCTDTAPGLAATYAERFADAVRAWRDRLDLPNLIVLTVQLNRHQTREATPEAHRGWDLVRDAQRRAAHHLPNVYVVPSLDATLSDEIHNSPTGNLLIGERLAQVCLGAVHGRDIAWAAPDISSATLGSASNTIVLTFDHVTDRMGSTSSSARPFAVRDALGDVPIQEIAYPGDNRISLLLTRPLDGLAMVQAAPGADPDLVPVDMGRMLPILGFCDVPVS